MGYREIRRRLRVGHNIYYRCVSSVCHTILKQFKKFSRFADDVTVAEKGLPTSDFGLPIVILRLWPSL